MLQPKSGLSKYHQWRLETWWWNELEDEAIEGERAEFKAYKSLGLQGGNTLEAKEAYAAYSDARSITVSPDCSVSPNKWTTPGCHW